MNQAWDWFRQEQSVSAILSDIDTLKRTRHIVPFPLSLLVCLVSFSLCSKHSEAAGLLQQTNPHQADTVPKAQKPQQNEINKYFNIITDRQARDSLLEKLSRKNEPRPVDDSTARLRRQNSFSPYRGKVIRNIYYNRLNVFGTQITDTLHKNTHKLVKFANRLHFNTNEWVIRQSLFFGENDTVNAYKMVENERYLRNLSFIQDARLYVINTYQDPDSIDVVVVTKDLFEYGGTVSDLSNTSFAANVYDNNLLGAGQSIQIGARWDEQLSPQWRSEMNYTKSNVGGTFTDISVGYSSLNDRGPIDSGVYERSYYVSANRPLYSSWAKFTGGLSLSHNASMNVYLQPNSQYRKYQYGVLDIWGGFNFRNQFKKDGFNSTKPNLALLLRQYNVTFGVTPWQPEYAKNPNYNDHHFTLAEMALFHQDFFKTNYFFGFGKTEDIPYGYNASLSGGMEEWVGIKRNYSGITGQKYWLSNRQNLLSTSFGLASFWMDGHSEDAVIQINTDYYSRLFLLNTTRIRQFFHVAYLVCPNPVLYKPLNINRENGIVGYRNTEINGYQRLNLSAQTTYYSPISLYGFKFNFSALLQGSLVTPNEVNIFKSPLYSGFTLGCSVRNESLPFNTLQFTGTYMPPAPGSPGPFFFQITTTTDIHFSIFALQAPAFIPYK